jgi:hypothetical protein
LHASNTGCVCGIPNFFGAGVHENSDRANFGRHRFDNSPGNLGPNIAWTLRVKVEPNHAGTHFSGCSSVFDVRDATNLDLH